MNTGKCIGLIKCIIKKKYYFFGKLKRVNSLIKAPKLFHSILAVAVVALVAVTVVVVLLVLVVVLLCLPSILFLITMQYFCLETLSATI